MLAAKNIVIELLSAVIWGTAIGLLMAITANSFVYLVVIATEYRTSFTLLEFQLQGQTYSLSSILSLLTAAILISVIRKILNIKTGKVLPILSMSRIEKIQKIETKKGLGSTFASLVVISGGRVGWPIWTTRAFWVNNRPIHQELF